jgi:HEAT repeat protein
MLTLGAAPLLAALTPSTKIPRPSTTEPDLLGDAVAPHWSERIEPPAPLRYIEATGPDAHLIAMLRDAAGQDRRAPDDYVPERARWALAQMRDGKLVEPLLEALDDDDWRVRAYAAWALGHSHDARATQPLTKLLESDIWRVRAMAAHAISILADRRAEAAMLRVIGDPAWQVRLEVVRYLRATGGDRATIEAMKQDRHIAVRSAAE